MVQNKIQSRLTRSNSNIGSSPRNRFKSPGKFQTLQNFGFASTKALSKEVGFYDKTFIFDIMLYQWKEVVYTTRLQDVSLRAAHATCNSGHELFIFGGISNDKLLDNSIFKLDIHYRETLHFQLNPDDQQQGI